jgi:hypothetical protein
MQWCKERKAVLKQLDNINYVYDRDKGECYKHFSQNTGLTIKASFSKKICGQPSTLYAMNPCFRNARTCVTPFWQIDLIVVVVLYNGVHILLIMFNCFWWNLYFLIRHSFRFQKCELNFHSLWFKMNKNFRKNLLNKNVNLISIQGCFFV